MNKLRKTALVTIAIAGFGMFAASCGGSGSTEHIASNEAIELKLNFKEGDKYLYTTEVDQKIESIMSMSQKMNMDMIFSYAGDSSGSKKLSITYDRIAMSMNSPMGQVNYDSKKPGSKGMPGMDSLVGKTFSVWMTPDGNIQKVEGLSGSGVGDSVVQTMIQGSFNIYPGKKVKIGDTWTRKTTMTIYNASLEVENTYRLKAIDGGKAVLDLNAVISLPKSGMGPEGAGMQMEIQGTQEGTIDVDIATGQMLSGKIKQELKGNITAEAMGQPMSMSVKSDITTSSKKL